MGNADILAHICAHFAGDLRVDHAVTDEDCLMVAAKDLVALCLLLRDDPALKFDFMSDICGVDFFPETPRFQLVYQLYSIPFKRRLRLKCRLEEPVAPTITEVWTTANWHEREAWDMYGIDFTGHPDLRRIYMWEGFEGFPMRRDFPLRGYKDEMNPFGDEPPAKGGAA
jgi:NADH-quinone oxidoreductase subunit C